LSSQNCQKAGCLRKISRPKSFCRT